MSIRGKDTRKLPKQALQEERLRRGWTQQEVANRVGTTVVNVSRWERGATFPNPYFRQKLCLLFEKDAEGLELLPMKQVSQSETTPTIAEVLLDLPEKEPVATTNETAPVPLRNHRRVDKRKVFLTVILIVLVIFLSGSGFFLYSFFFSESRIAHLPVATGYIIAQDTFKRANQTFWGSASDGLPWEGDANTLKNFSIVHNTAQITPVHNQDNYNAVLGATAKDAEVTVSGSLSSFDSSNLGAVLRWKDTNNWYKAYIDGMSLVIQKKLHGTTHYLQTVAFAANSENSYTIRFQVVGTLLLAKVWIKGSIEPNLWMATTNDTSFTEGFCGLRIKLLNGAIATVTSFVARQDA